MEFEFTVDEEQACLFATVRGEITEAAARKAYEKLSAICTKHNCTRVLSDVTEASIHAPSVTLYAMAKTLDDLKISRTLKRALVVANDHDHFAFWETVCFNQGYSNVRIFTDHEAAKLWLFDNK